VSARRWCRPAEESWKWVSDIKRSFFPCSRLCA